MKVLYANNVKTCVRVNHQALVFHEIIIMLKWKMRHLISKHYKNKIYDYYFIIVIKNLLLLILLERNNVKLKDVWSNSPWISVSFLIKKKIFSFWHKCPIALRILLNFSVLLTRASFICTKDVLIYLFETCVKETNRNWVKDKCLLKGKRSLDASPINLIVPFRQCSCLVAFVCATSPRRGHIQKGVKTSESILGDLVAEESYKKESKLVIKARLSQPWIRWSGPYGGLHYSLASFIASWTSSFVQTSFPRSFIYCCILTPSHRSWNPQLTQNNKIAEINKRDGS